MEPNFTEALTLLGIGMITVFLVLMLVVATGNILISFVNRYAKDVVVTPAKSENIPTGELVAITAAVEAFTLGKGRITKIEKKN